MNANQRNRLTSRTTWERVGSWFVFLFFLFGFYVNNSGGLLDLFSPQYGYQGWEISEWLINYEGGFVRRGLLGQALLALEQAGMYDVRVAIQLIYTLSSVVILFIIGHVFKAEGWSPLLLLTGLCLGYTLFNPWGRKDFLMLALTFMIFHCYRTAVTRHQRGIAAWILLYVLSALQLLAHEGSFFFTFPILMLHSYCESRSHNLSSSRSAASSLLRFLPVLAVMAAVIIFRGNNHVADAIWASWDKVFATYPADGGSQIGLGVQALTWDPVTTFNKHLYSAYVGSDSPSYWGIPLALSVIVSAYYLLTRIDSATMGKSRPKQPDRTLLSNVSLVQFISLIPMFTILSCDWGRTLPYWMLSTLFFYHIFKHDAGTFPACLTSVSQATQRFIGNSKLLSSRFTYLLLVLVTPVPNYFAPLNHLNTIQHRCYLYLSDAINHISTLLMS